MNMLKLYDWALDDRLLVYKPPRQKYLCPQGHEVKEKKYGLMLCSACNEFSGAFYVKNDCLIKE